MGTADLADLLQIEGVLAHAGLPDCFPTKGTRSHKEHKRIGLIRDRKEWGAAPRPGRGRALSHPRERRTENRERSAPAGRRMGPRKN